MTAMSIDADTLKTLRKARKLGRPKLAKLAGLTERQVARLEGAAPMRDALAQDSVLRIAAALGVSAEVLFGDAPLTDFDLQPAAKSSCTSGCCG
ncbi:helix-turn-helix transcriptional regulator [Shimia sp.]|uniref:helix-turn-helix transcriptional regulator n=1 Tax=Shimia sp. TaxID=1954381 RepID=UPI003B8CAFA5